jgi:ABC-type transport system involved in multi-copper enzyme maturation permease subunit
MNIKVLHIAKNTFRECVRDKVLYNLVIFAVLIIVSSLILGAITIGDVKQIIINLGLSTISFFGTLIAIFIGIQLVHKEIDKKTVFSLLSKPVARHEFILGKYLGLSMTLAVNVAVMILGVYSAVLYLRHFFQASDVQIFLAGVLILIKLMLVIAIALLFSTFSTPALSALFTFCLYIIGHFNSDIRQYGVTSDSWMTKVVAGVLYYLLPNFGNFDVISKTAHGQFIASGVYLFSAIYGLIYSLGLLLIAMWIFQKRDFK